jgi:hypothetical protein
LLFQRAAISASCYFSELLFQQAAISASCYFSELLFHQVAISSSCCQQAAISASCQEALNYKYKPVIKNISNNEVVIKQRQSTIKNKLIK